MATWAKVNSENKVEQVIVTDSNLPDAGASWIADNLDGNWIQTFSMTDVLAGLDSPRRRHPAGIGMTYDADADVFIPESPFPSWTLNTNTFLWEPPTPKPNPYTYWDEDALEWKPIPQSEANA